MISLRQIANTLVEVLQQEIPEVIWQANVMGAQWPKILMGFICCDSIDYTVIAKDRLSGTARFTIEIIHPAPKEETPDIHVIEDYAQKVHKVLLSPWRGQDGTPLDAKVERIQFATPAGINTIGLAILQVQVII